MHTQLPFFAIIHVSGENRHSFLHNQLSNDINNLPEHCACYATYNTPKGRVMANMLVYHVGDALLLALAADLADKVLARLKMFVLRAKVDMSILADWGVSGSLPDGITPRVPDEPHLQLPVQASGEIALPHGGTMRIAPKNQLPEYHADDETIWNLHEIQSGYPWVSAATSETCVAQMLNQHTIGGVHFRKGCYPGQEIIARAQYRGQVKRGLVSARNAVALPVGAEVRNGEGEEVGLVLNAAADWQLLVLKHSAAEHAVYDDAGHELTLEHMFF